MLYDISEGVSTLSVHLWCKLAVSLAAVGVVFGYENTLGNSLLYFLSRPIGLTAEELVAAEG